MNLLRQIQDRLRSALAGLVEDPEPYVAMVRTTQDAKHGDYQANCAMSLAKKLDQKPRDVAQTLVDKLERGDLLEKPEVAGPGFINLRLKAEGLSRLLQTMARSDRLGVEAAHPPKQYVIDFSSPNVAKPMHVGHLRSTILGDSLTRLLRFLGHRVVTDNHLGDWGTQFGILLHGYKTFLDQEAWQKDPMREMVRLYIHVRSLMKDDEEEEGHDPIAEAARQETAKLHAGDPENLAIWKQFMPLCQEEIDVIYRRLDVQFDHTYGESFYNPLLPGVVADLKAKGIAEESEGAVVIFFGAKEPPALIQKRDGAFTYTTTDLATIRYRIEIWKPNEVIYVVDARQSLHFKNLFLIARRWGYEGVELTHVSFGSVLGKDGKPIKTREGGAVELGALLDEAIERAGQVMEANLEEVGEVSGLSSSERKTIQEVVGLGAVKYADLCQNRTSDYKFDFEKMLAMNGNTATYMQYAYARNRSILRKGEVDPAKYHTNPPRPILETEYERALALQLLRLEETLLSAAADYQPSVITSYLWDLAKTYSGFFQNCPVLKAPTPELRESRLLLCDLTARVLQTCLNLLGIRTVERM